MSKNNQPSLFTGDQLRDDGMKRSTDHANRKTPKWSDVAFDFLKAYIREHETFMAEDVRSASENVVPAPPDNRAWGSIIVRARKEKLIVANGYGKQKQSNCHSGIATIWKIK